MADRFEEKLREMLGDSLEGRVGKKISEFGGLLTRGAAVRLLCKQHGIEVEKKLSLQEAAQSQLPFSFEAKIRRIFPVQPYQGIADRSVRLHLSDPSGEATLVLWNEQAALVEGTLSIGDTVSCSGAVFRSGEISVSKGGRIAKTASYPIKSVGELEHGICNVWGEVRQIETDWPYLGRKAGEKKPLSSFQLCDGENCRRVVIWSAPGEAVRPEFGDRLLLENVVFKAGELHFNAYSRMVKKSSASDLHGLLDGVAFQKGSAVFSIGNKEFALPVDAALSLLGIRAVPEGVRPETLLSIKSSAMVGKRARYRLDKGILFWLELS